MLERVAIFLINLFFPPLSVMLITGTPGPDFLINVFLLLLAVIPAHIHGFYLSCTYFHRKNKVRKGRYPGGRKSGIYSEVVWNGGANDREMRRLRDKERIR